MKPSAVKKSNVQRIDVKPVSDNLNIINSDHSFRFEDFTLPQPMYQKEIQPPAYIWDKIANILDEQDRKKAFCEQPSFATPTQKAGPKKFFLLAAVVMMIGAVVLSVL